VPGLRLRGHCDLLIYIALFTTLALGGWAEKTHLLSRCRVSRLSHT